MSTSVCYWRFIKIGTSMLSMTPNPSRRAAGSVMGLDQKVSTPESLNPNFEFMVEVMVGFHGSAWSRIDLHEALFDAVTDVVDESYDNPTGPLCWIDDEAQTTTTSNTESAGSGVQIEVASVSALNVAVNDYVLLINTSSQIGQLAKVTAKDGSSITVDTLDEDLASGSTVLKVFMAYPDCVFQGADLGRPVENSDDRYRFSTFWRFISGGIPVKSATP